MGPEYERNSQHYYRGALDTFNSEIIALLEAFHRAGDFRSIQWERMLADYEDALRENAELRKDRERLEWYLEFQFDFHALCRPQIDAEMERRAAKSKAEEENHD